MKKILLIIVITVTVIFSVFAQLPKPNKILLDTISTLTESELPFDRPFILYFQGSEALSISSGIVVSLKEKDGDRKLKENRNGKLVKLYEFFDKDVSVQGKGVAVYIKPLPPNENIAIIIGHHFDGSLLTESLRINESLYRTSNETDDGMRNLIDSSVQVLIDTLKRHARHKAGNSSDFTEKERDAAASFNFPYWSEDIKQCYEEFFNKRLSATYHELFDSTEYNNFSYPLSFSELSIANISKVAQLAELKKRSSPELEQLISILYRGLLKEVQMGIISLNADFPLSEVDSYKIDLRLANLKATKKSIEHLRQSIETLNIIVNDSVVNEMLKQVGRLQNVIERNIQLVNGAWEKIKKEIENEVNLSYTTWVFGNNQIFDLKTKGTRYVIPVVGLTALYGFGNYKNEFFVRPYLGASIYLRPIDKDVPFSALSNKFLHRFSVNLGITTGKISKSEFSDLYNSFSLMLGGNFKITQGIQISTGTVFLHRKHENIAINTPKVSYLNPYFSVGFDLDLVNAIKSMIDKL